MKTLLLGQDAQVGHWVAARTKGTYEQGARGIGLQDESGLIAGVLYDHWNGASIAMHVAAEPGKRWMTKRYLWTCFDYPFNQVGAHKVIGLVSSANKQTLEFDKHLGFTQEGKIEGGCRDGDLLILTMTKDQCRWLSLGDRYGR